VDGVRERAARGVRGAAGGHGRRPRGDAAAQHGVGRRRRAAWRRGGRAGRGGGRRGDVHARGVRPGGREQGLGVVLHGQPGGGRRRWHGAQYILCQSVVGVVFFSYIVHILF
jgi:hypothetical protein